jgi:hypothetical protein
VRFWYDQGRHNLVMGTNCRTMLEQVARTRQALTIS